MQRPRETNCLRLFNLASAFTFSDSMDLAATNYLNGSAVKKPAFDDIKAAQTLKTRTAARVVEEPPCIGSSKATDEGYRFRKCVTANR